VEIDIAKDLTPDGVAVCVKVRLSGREASKLFVSGDTLVELPLEGSVPGAGDDGTSPMPRSAIFLSELAGLTGGFTRVFADHASADAFAAAVGADLGTALERG
jgi:hypothetical protein